MKTAGRYPSGEEQGEVAVFAGYVVEGDFTAQYCARKIMQTFKGGGGGQTMQFCIILPAIEYRSVTS